MVIKYVIKWYQNVVIKTKVEIEKKTRLAKTKKRKVAIRE
jgi:hypothetical protein